MKVRITLLAVLGALIVAPAAEARPYLGFGEASRQIGGHLRSNFAYGATPGSLTTDCWRLARNRVRCYISFADDDYDTWCGIGAVRENRAFYIRRYDVDPC